MDEGLTTFEVVTAVGVDYHRVDRWVRRGVVTPAIAGAEGTGSRRSWSPDQVRVVALVSVLADHGAPTRTLRAAARTAEGLEDVEGRGVWGATMLVTEDGRMLSPLTCNDHGWLVRLSRCRSLAVEVERVRRLALVS